jgi:hypothetical protein
MDMGRLVDLRNASQVLLVVIFGRVPLHVGCQNNMWYGLIIELFTCGWLHIEVCQATIDFKVDVEELSFLASRDSNQLGTLLPVESLLSTWGIVDNNTEIFHLHW